MKTKSLIYTFVSCIFLSSCMNDAKERGNPQAIIGNWRLFEAVQNDKKNPENSDKLLNEAQAGEAAKEGVLLSFFPDSTFTELKGSGNYKFGTWYYLNSKEILLSSAVGKDTFGLKSSDIDGKPMLALSSKTAQTRLIFSKYANLAKNYKEDPFHSENNLWRLKPNHAENAAELHERLGNHFKHMTYLLKVSVERDDAILSTEFSGGLVKIYRGGIGITPLQYVPKTWFETYFDENDALTAYKMFDNYLATSDSYNGASSGDWRTDDYKILTSIYGDVKQGKFPKIGK